MMGSSRVALEETLEQSLFERGSLRAVKAVMDRRRPRLVENDKLVCGPSIVQDFDNITAMMKDDEACVVVVWVKDDAGTMPQAEATDTVVITWIPDKAATTQARAWSNVAASLMEAMSPNRCKHYHTTEKGQATFNSFNSKAQELFMVELEYHGSSNCGQVQFTVKGTMLANNIVHNPDSTWCTGSYPSHEVTLPKDSVKFTQGKELVKEFKASKGHQHFFCSNCGSHLYQAHMGESVIKVFPTTFHIKNQDDCKLPKVLVPAGHTHYENRQWDWNDDLPKFKEKADGARMDNRGDVI